MSFLASLCGCFTRDPSEKSTPQSRPGSIRGDNLTQPPHYNQNHENHHGPSWDVNNGYSSVAPLPPYTPRPVSMQEKTLHSNTHNNTDGTTPHDPDQKTRHEFQESRSPSADDVGSDASSAISFPSSYGNTSTATRETPPPPYSSSPSTRSRSSSMQEMGLSPWVPCSMEGVLSSITPPPMVHIPQPQQPFRRPEFLYTNRLESLPRPDDVGNGQTRRSWEMQ